MVRPAISDAVAVDDGGGALVDSHMLKAGWMVEHEMEAKQKLSDHDRLGRAKPVALASVPELLLSDDNLRNAV